LPLLVDMLINGVEVPWEHDEEGKEWCQVEHVKCAHSDEVEHAHVNWPDADVPHFFDSLQGINFPNEKRHQ